MAFYDDDEVSRKPGLKPAFKAMSVDEFTGASTTPPPEAPAPEQVAAVAVPLPEVAHAAEVALPVQEAVPAAQAAVQVAPSREQEEPSLSLKEQLKDLQEKITAGDLVKDIETLRTVEAAKDSPDHAIANEAAAKERQLTSDIRAKLGPLLDEYNRIVSIAAAMKPPIPLPAAPSLSDGMDASALSSVTTQLQSAIGEAQQKVEVQQTAQTIEQVAAVVATVDAVSSLAENAPEMSSALSETRQQLRGDRRAIAELAKLEALLEGHEEKELGHGKAHPGKAHGHSEPGHHHGLQAELKHDAEELADGIKHHDGKKIAHALEDINKREISAGLKGMPEKALKAALAEFDKLQTMSDGSQFLKGATEPKPELAGFTKLGQESLPGAPVIKVPARDGVALPA